MQPPGPSNCNPLRESTKTPISLDEYVGKKLRDFRERIGLTLEDCAKKIGVSHQQIHKYELGQTKISPSILYKYCKLFSVNPNVFFEGYYTPEEESDLWEEEIISYEHLKKINIILFEDNSEEQFIIRKILAEYNMLVNVFCIHSGDEFLEIIKRRADITQAPSPDLIFLDLNVPKIDGIAILRMIKQSPDLKHIPVIILTGSMRTQDVINAYKNYASGYIRKSFEYETLKEHLHLAIRYWTEAVILPTQVRKSNSVQTSKEIKKEFGP